MCAKAAYSGLSCRQCGAVPPWRCSAAHSLHQIAGLPCRLTAKYCTASSAVNKHRLRIDHLITSHCHASGLAAGSDEGSAAPRVAGHPLCTCHLVPAPSAALAAIYAVVTQEPAGARPATCVLRPASYSATVRRAPGSGSGHGMVLFFPLAMSVAEACPVVSWQHAIHGGISVFREMLTHISHWVVSITRRGGKHHPPSKPAPSSRSLAAPKTSVQVEKPLPGPSVSTRHAVGY